MVSPAYCPVFTATSIICSPRQPPSDTLSCSVLSERISVTVPFSYSAYSAGAAFSSADRGATSTRTAAKISTAASSTAAVRRSMTGRGKASVLRFKVIPPLPKDVNSVFNVAIPARSVKPEATGSPLF